MRTYWDSTGKVSFTSPRAFVLVTSSGSSNIGGLVLSIWSLAVLTPYRLVDNISKQAVSDYYHVQRASWLLPIVDHGIDNDEEVRKYLKNYTSPANYLLQDNQFAGLYCGRVRREIWNMFENPNSSLPAKVNQF